MSTNFFENPFAKLAHVPKKTRLSKDKAKHITDSSPLSESLQVPSMSTSKNASYKKNSSHIAHDHNDDYDDECALFLHSMSKIATHVPAKERTHTASAFCLTDHIPSWQAPSVRKKQKKKHMYTHEKAFMSHESEPAHKVSVNTRMEAAPPSFEQLFLKEEQTDDTHAFLQATKDVVPLAGRGRDVVPEVLGVNVNQYNEEDFRRLLEGKLEFSLALKGEYLEGHVVGLDPRILENLRAGNYSPEAHIDLHGLNAMQAYRALLEFFRRSWYKGLRAVLIVPGRGKNSLNGFAVLRDKLQLWLTQDPFKRVVLAFCTAQAIDGGPGSVYVLLRKYKKKGKIHWERIPADADLY